MLFEGVELSVRELLSGALNGTTEDIGDIYRRRGPAYMLLRSCRHHWRGEHRGHVSRGGKEWGWERVKCDIRPALPSSKEATRELKKRRAVRRKHGKGKDQAVLIGPW